MCIRDRSSTQYEQQSGNVIQVTDAKGKSISYGFNESTRQNTSVTDAEGNETAYTYGNAAEMLRPVSYTHLLEIHSRKISICWRGICF